MSAPRPLPSPAPELRAPAPVGDGPPSQPALPAPPVPPRRRRRLATSAGLAVLVVVVTVAGIALVRGEAARSRELDQALAALDGAAASLTAARRDGSAVLAASAGQVHDEQVRRDLAALLVGLPASEPPDGGPRADRTALAARQADAVRTRGAALASATAVVREQHARWLLTSATTERMAAHAHLAAAVVEGRAALAASEGRVPDDAARAALGATLDDADAARGTRADGGVGAGDAEAARPGVARPAARVEGGTAEALAAAGARAADLREQAAELHAHVEAIEAARAVLAEAEAAWQAEQDRLAAERSAADRAATGDRRSAGDAPVRGGADASRTRGGAPGGSGDPGAPPASPASPPGEVPDGDQGLPPGWTRVEETEGGAWCGDEFGASWEC